MNRARRKRLAACLVYLLLFMQVAVSAYACLLGEDAASAGPGSAVAVAASAADEMPCHTPQSEPEPSNLCKAHCAQPAQSVDTRAPVKLDLVYMPALVPAPPPRLQQLERVACSVLARPAPPGHPPLYLDHCRFLI